jgi:radical SAM superfamily enzyme YgiQ (UPF0313 family)
MARRTFQIALIKPSHYDDDGYVIRWHRSSIPSNSLASVHGLLADCAEKYVLGPDVDIRIEAYDECNTAINVAAISASIRKAGYGFVGLVGVQSNQYPRALELARRFRAAGLVVVIGGFHVSGCLSMLPELPPGLQAAQEIGVILYAGEGEGRLDQLLRDIDRGEAKPIYNYMHDLPGLEDAVAPILPRHVVRRIVGGGYASFDAGRGCPFQCSFCTIINVQGRKSRYRTADDVEAIVRANAAIGVNHFFVTDDNFARNKNWEAILDRLIELRESGVSIRLVLQVDTLCHKTPGFIEKAAKAGCNAVFIGLENINPQSLAGAKKRQNKIWEYREMLQEWRRQRVMTWAGYILGFPTDTPESIARDIETIKRELPIDILEFFFLTPLPGSEDHKRLHLQGVAMDPDMNNYDLEHVTTSHPLMTQEVWKEVYRDAWRRYYTDEHVETVIRRAVRDGIKARKVADVLTVFSGGLRIEGVHPLQLGLIRRKSRRERRPELGLESPLIFYPRRLWEVLSTGAAWASLYWRYHGIKRRVLADPRRMDYSDEALRPATEEAALPDFVHAFADKIPRTYGAPTRAAMV